jgi:hypothetical protein
LGTDLGHGGATRPCAGSAIKIGVVPLGDGKSFAPLFAQHRVFNILNPATSEYESIWQDEAIAVAELTVE